MCVRVRACVRVRVRVRVCVVCTKVNSGGLSGLTVSTIL